MANLLSTITHLFERSLQGEPPPPVILNGLGTKLSELLDLSADGSGDGISRWLSKLHEITGNTRLHETLLVRTLQMHFPRAAELLTLLGVVKFEYEIGDSIKPIAFAIDWEKYNNLLHQPGDEALNLFLTKVASFRDISALKVLLLLLFSSPIELLRLEYRNQGFSRLPLGESGVNSDELIKLIKDLVYSPLILPLPFTPPLTLAEFIGEAKKRVNGSQGSLIIRGPAEGELFNKLVGFSVEVDLKNPSLIKPITIEDNWSLGFNTTEITKNIFDIAFTSNGIDTNILSESSIDISLSKIPNNTNALLLGDQNGTHFSIQNISLGLELNNKNADNPKPPFVVKIKFGKIEFALKPDFLRFLSFGLNIPEQLLFESDVELSYVQGKGLSGQGANGTLPALGIEFATPLNLKIGGVGAGINIDNVVTRLEIKNENADLFFKVIFRYGANAEFGPLKVFIDGAGVWLGRWSDGNGGLIPPKGIGVSIDAGPVKGGGFLEVINENEFAGAFHMTILGIGAFAYCIYKTLPTGEVSFVSLIGIRIPPPGIQISFGFAVTGFGGLVGINRKADTDLIRERLSTGSAGDVLFNDDPMKNAPKLLGDMQLFFPALKDGFIIGPTFQINWLYIVTLDVGLFIQLPGPTIFIAGSAKLVIGSEEFALINLRMDILGGIDTTKSLIFLDGHLVNSSVLGIFRITGGMALRVAYGDNGYFLFSVGGFNTAFNPGQMELPKLQRAGVTYKLDSLWLKNEMYLALTSNTFQLGCSIEAGLEIGPITANGSFSFDSLIEFKPFSFVGKIHAGFDVEAKGVSIANVMVTGTLSGPGPLVLEARASVKILVRIHGHVTVTLINNPPEFLESIHNVALYLKDQGEISNPDNVRPEGEDSSVILAPNSTSLKLFSPVGTIIWEQKRVPLQLPIQKLAGIALIGYHKISVTTDKPSIPEYDWFGVGTYLVLKDAEALNNALFVKQQSGIRIGAGPLVQGVPVDAELEINLVKLPSRELLGKFPISNYLSGALARMLNERISGAKIEAGKPKIKVVGEIWDTYSQTGSVRNSIAFNSTQAFVEARQYGGIALPKGEKKLDLTGII